MQLFHLNSYKTGGSKIQVELHASGGLFSTWQRSGRVRHVSCFYIRESENKEINLTTGLTHKLTVCVGCVCSAAIADSCAVNVPRVKAECWIISHGVCLFSLSKSGSRLSGSRGRMCTSGEESSVELSCAQLDTDEQQSPEERLVRSKAPQLKFKVPQTPSEYLSVMIQVSYKETRLLYFMCVSSIVLII